MSFGKRTPRRPEVPKTPTPAYTNAPSARRGLALVKTVAGFSAGIAIVIIFAAMYKSYMLNLGHQLNQQFEAQLDQSTNAKPRMALLESKQADGWRFGKCTLLKPVQAQDSINPGRFGNRDVFGSDISTEESDRAWFLDCMVHAEGTQLCNSEIRAAFVSDIKAFYRENDSLVSQMAVTQLRNQPNSHFAELVGKVDNAFPGFRGSMEAPYTETLAARERVDDALRDAARSGYISSKDFGFFASSKIKLLISTIETDAQPCKY